MSSKNSANKETEKKNRKKASAKNQERPWQWFFLYPTFGVAVLSAIPTWTHGLQEFYFDLKNISIQEARENDRLMRRNLECMAAPAKWVERTNNILIDGHFCKSGDVFLRIKFPESVIASTSLNGITGDHFKFIGMDKLLEEYKSLQAARLGFVSAAYARGLPVNQERGYPSIAQGSFAITLCQRFEGTRTLIRHVRIDGVCFDEVVDTFTGALIDRQEVPCNAACT